MSNENDTLKIEQLKNEVDRLSSELEAAKQTIARQAQQIEDLKSGLGSGLDSLPKEVREDAQQRMRDGLPKDIAIERALVQARHNKNLAEAKADAATATPTGTKKAKA